MSRRARVVLDDVPVHVTQRGNGRQQVFLEASDYRLYLDLLVTYARDSELTLLAYCLMPNHVHLVALPKRTQMLAGALSRTHGDYARHFNLRRRRCGHVWQARFFSCPLEEGHLWNAIAYIERNPVRAKMVEQAEEFAWSSAWERLSAVGGLATVVELTKWQERYTAEQWRQVLATSIEEEALCRRRSLRDTTALWTAERPLR